MPNPVRTMYCEECRTNVPVEECEDGTVIIRCPKCTGECMLCDCHLAANCFEPTTRVIVTHYDPDGKDS
jgi:hypothetical protein